MAENHLKNRVIAAYGDAITSSTEYRGEVTHVVMKDYLRGVCNYLKTDPAMRFDYLVDVLGVDYPDRLPRFEVVYHLYSTTLKQRIRLKVQLADGESVPTVSDIWAAADWPERETYDMFGIRFDDHPDMRRIYLEEGWVGYPLRKDYPLRGYKDRYNPFGEDSKE